jgi:hypothetical protein
LIDRITAPPALLVITGLDPAIHASEPEAGIRRWPVEPTEVSPVAGLGPAIHALPDQRKTQSAGRG